MFSLPTALLCVSALPPTRNTRHPGQNHPTPVNLRIEGANNTVFEGHNVTTASGGTHLCDGTKDGANAFPGPTCTSALADAEHGRRKREGKYLNEGGGENRKRGGCEEEEDGEDEHGRGRSRKGKGGWRV